MFRADHPSNSKHVGVCIFYKETLALQVSIQNSKDYVGVLYRSPSQDNFEFENFLLNFKKRLSDTNQCNSLFTMILGDFDARYLV